MSYLKIRKEFIRDTILKFKRLYGIDLNLWLPNPYKRLKYLYIIELGAIISLIAFKLNLKPNFITILNIIFALIALVVFVFKFTDLFYIAFFIIFSKNILDNVDGFIARIKNLKSKFGEKLDFISAQVYYHAILLSFCFHNYYLTANNFSFFIYALIIFLDITNPGKKLSKKTKIFKIKKVEKNNNFYLSIIRFFNYDGRTVITDIMIFVMAVEIQFNLSKISESLIYIFIFTKILRNLFYIIKR